MKQKRSDLLKLLFALALTAAIILNHNTLSNLDVRALINGASGIPAAAAIVLGVYVLKAVVFVVPASLIYIAVGMAFETPLAVAINCVGILLEIIVTYSMGKLLGKDTVERRLQGTKAGEKLLHMNTKNQNLAVFTIRFTGIPIDFSSLFMGAFGFRFLPYVLFSLLGILPRVILLTVIGDRFYDLIPMKYIILAAIVLIPAVTAGALLKKHFDKKKKQSEENV